jgi:hypothetical protein
MHDRQKETRRKAGQLEKRSNFRRLVRRYVGTNDIFACVKSFAPSGTEWMVVTREAEKERRK